MAEAIKWDESCRVGIKELDAAHQKLFGIGNRLILAVARDGAAAPVAEVLDDLIEFAEEHFGREEELMAESAYPDRDAHRREHRRLMNDLRLFKSQWIGGDVDGSQVSTFVIEWIVKHTKDSDRKYGPHLNAHGIE